MDYFTDLVIGASSFLERSAIGLGGGQRLRKWISWLSHRRVQIPPPRPLLIGNWLTDLEQPLIKWKQTIRDEPSAQLPRQWRLFSSYLRTCPSWWDKQYVWSIRDAVQLSREMMLYEVSSCAAIWRESHLTILGDYSIYPRALIPSIENRQFFLV